MNCILCAASTYTKECALLQFRICRKCRRKTAHYTLFRSKMSKEVAQQTCVSLCPSPDVEKAPLHPFVALFCPSSHPDVADHTDAEELPVLVSIQLFPPTISGWSTILVSLLFISSRLLGRLGQSHTHCSEFLRKSSNVHYERFVICAAVGKYSFTGCKSS